MEHNEQDVRPLAEQVSDRLMDYILKQELKSGERMPTEIELTEQLGVGRSTIREAVKILASRNILEVRHGAGTFVADNVGITEDPLGFAFIRDKRKLTHDLLEVRMLIEPPIAAMAARNATQEDIVLLEESYNKVERLILAGLPYLKEDVIYHQRIAAASKNLVVPNLTPIISQAVNLFTTRTGCRLRKETIETHRAVLEAIKRRDSIAAQDAMVLHLVYNRNLLREIEAQEDAKLKEKEEQNA